MDGKVPIIVWADLKTAPLGQASKLRADLGGKPVLRRTMERICRTKESGQIIVYCPPDQAEEIQTILTGLEVEVQAVQFDLPGWWKGLQASRKWASAGWRGGLLGACAFDEDLQPHVATQIARRYRASAVMSVSAHAAWVDPETLDRQIVHYLKHQESTKLNFTQAPPGLTGVILDIELLEQLTQSLRIAGAHLGYQPDHPQIDLISQSCNLSLDPQIVQTPIRFTCDTQRSLALGRKLAEIINIQDADITQIIEAAGREASAVLTQTPTEIEIELISGWPWEMGYRPTPDRPRGPIDPERIIRSVEELAKECDDLLVHIGGFGEPTRHPQFEQIITGLKQAGVWGISVATTGLIEPQTAQKLADLPIDIINVLIDIPERELYRKLTGIDGYPKALEIIDLLIRRVQTNARPTPLLVPEMIKTHETMELMDEFFDGWFRKVGWAVIGGFNDRAGQIPDKAVNSMAGPQRRACRSIMNRLTLLADGQAGLCRQDFNARFPAGAIDQTSIAELWNSPALAGLRQAHRDGNFSPNGLCENCRQWHRP